MLFAPGFDRCQEVRRARLGSVEEIPEEDDLARIVATHQAIEPRQVLMRRTARHRLAKRAVGGGLAEVKIGNEEHALGWPPDGRVGQEFDLLACEFDAAGHGEWKARFKFPRSRAGSQRR